METNIDILNELRAISPLLAGMEKVNVFTVPQGYFEALSELISGIVKERETGILNEFPRKNSLEVPAGYFDNLANTILNRIKASQNETAADELRQLSPMLYSIQNENIFEVPPGYFAGLTDKILDKVQAPKVIAMRTRSNVFIKYAVAAAFTGAMALGVFKFATPTAGNSEEPSYVTAGKQLKNTNVDDELAKVSDEDIIKYLQSNGENMDAQTVANKTLDENELPSQADYLQDDKALDKYLDNMNANDLKN